MFEWLKRLFSKPSPVADTQEHPISAQDATEKMSIKPCKSCGKPITYDPSWQHIPNYCPECKGEIQGRAWGAEVGEEDGKENLSLLWPDIHLPIGRQALSELLSGVPG